MSDHNSVPSNASASTSVSVIAPEKQSSNSPNRTGTLTLDWRLEAIEAAKITSIIRRGISGDEDFKRALDAMIHF